MSAQSISFSEFEVVSITPGIYVGSVGDENVKIRVFVVPLNVVRAGDSYSVVFNAVISVTTDKPRHGEQCDPLKFANHEGKTLKDFKALQRAETKVRVNDDKTVKVSLEVTNVSVYPDLRDFLGNPCVRVSWVQFQSV